MTKTKTRKNKLGKCGTLAFRAIIDGTYASQVMAVCGMDFDGLPYDVRLCHGFPIATRGVAVGKRIFHAWLEIGQENENGSWQPWFVVDCGSFEDQPMRLFIHYQYYHHGKIVAADVQRYTRREAARECLVSRHTGPWRPTPPDVV